MKAPASSTANIRLAPRTLQKESAYPFTAPAAIERMTEGTRMRSEFQKPTLMPLQASPVQAEDQAVIQGWSVGAAGQARMLPSRTSSMGLSEVTTMIHKGRRKKRAAVTRKA